MKEEQKRYVPCVGDVLAPKDGERTFHSKGRWDVKVDRQAPLLILEVVKLGVCAGAEEFLLEFVEIGSGRQFEYEDNEYGVARFFDKLN